MFRRYGVELEVVGLDVYEATSILKKHGFSNWKSVADYSVCGCLNVNVCSTKCSACEIVSPILNDEKDLLKLEQVADLILSKGGKTNSSCGFHVHIDAFGLSAQQCLQIYKRYAYYEGAIDLFHPTTRRKNNNNYCLSVKPTVMFIDDNNDNTIKFESKQSIAFLFDKYYKLNLVSLDKFGTLEFRQHKGSLNYFELQHWIRFCQDFMSASLNTNFERDSLFRGINDATKEYYLAVMENS